MQLFILYNFLVGKLSRLKEEARDKLPLSVTNAEIGMMWSPANTLLKIEFVKN